MVIHFAGCNLLLRNTMTFENILTVHYRALLIYVTSNQSNYVGCFFGGSKHPTPTRITCDVAESRRPNSTTWAQCVSASTITCTGTARESSGCIDRVVGITRHPTPTSGQCLGTREPTGTRNLLTWNSPETRTG